MNTHKLKAEYTVTDFLPLIVIFLVIVAFVAVRLLILGEWNTMFATTQFMAGFFLIFAGFKLYNIHGFVMSYQDYDIVAKRSKAYAYIYPFIELALGLLYLFGLFLIPTNIVTLILMLVSSIGVFQAVFSDQYIPCACLGDVFRLPMTYVTLGEDLLMALMAAGMLFILL